MHDALRPQPTKAFDPRVLRRALGNFATGVTIVTANDGDAMVGVTANSFSSVSLDPPLVLWSIDKRSSSFPVFQRASHFAINILSMGQIELSNRFARPSDSRYSGVEWRSGHGGCVLLEDTSASFQCRKHQIIDGGDHWIMIGQVVDFEDNGSPPLVYHQGAYSMVLSHPQRERENPPVVDKSVRGRLADHTYFLLTQAVRSYQQSYQPEQVKIGWRPSEARVLMLLDDGLCRDVAALAHDADMPVHAVEQTLILLVSRGLVRQADGGYELTREGCARVCDIWALAQHHEAQILSQFDEAEIAAFKRVLKGIMAAGQTT
ncbi:p-hydroxyphenylacetate 3-hydroxylase reductase component [Castellaniella sp.]|uniref:p-hydroxyphenylacetate 3-hydroxylase reductase component n=1 Tax=Castellaniella sp. TaxID=1955812 RepID=UPI002AFF13DD|nr:flavin reductase [Castellaniella sp.]